MFRMIMWEVGCSEKIFVEIVFSCQKSKIVTMILIYFPLFSCINFIHQSIVTQDNQFRENSYWN